VVDTGVCARSKASPRVAVVTIAQSQSGPLLAQDAGARPGLQHPVKPVVAVGLCGELPVVRVPLPALPAAGVAVQAGEARRGGAAPGQRGKPQMNTDRPR